MTNSALDPIQTWLWSVLDDLGIDGVIYGRHILNVLINSKHSLDHSLDVKEQSIFSKIAPSTIKKKKRISRRSSSLSTLEEIIWKKEMAVTCLMSATETKVNSDETESVIQKVVDELYTRLSSLNLMTDGKISTSDDDYSTTVGYKSSIQKKKRNKENYEDAFPSLGGSEYGSATPKPFVGSVWNKMRTGKSNSKRGCDSARVMKTSNNLSCDPPARNESQQQKNFSGKCTSHHVKSNAKSHSRNANKHFQFPLQPRYPRKLSATKQFKTTPRHCHPEKKSLKSPRSRARVQLKFDSVASPQKSRGKRNKRSKKGKTGVGWKKKSNEDNCQLYGDSCDNEFHLHYAHLPSWMESTLIGISQRSGILSKCNTHNMPESSDESVYGDEINYGDGIQQPEMAFSKRWFREQESGLLTYRPLSMSESSSTEGEEKEVCDRNDKPSKVGSEEIWMWCPSPSLWEDGTESPVSRLESVYKKELMSFDTEKHADSLSGRMWDEYQPIFQELNDLISTSDTEESNDLLSRDDFCHTLSKNVNKTMSLGWIKPERGTVGNEYGHWDKWNRDAVLVRNLGLDDVAIGYSDRKEPAPLSPSDHNIWKYSPKNSKWPSKDGVQSATCYHNELSEVLLKGMFGIPYGGIDDGWPTTPAKMPNVDNAGVMTQSNTLGKGCDDKMTSALVDALFGDLDFDWLTMLSTDHADVMPNRSMSSLNLELHPSLAFDLQSLFLDEDFERFRSANDEAWRPKLDVEGFWKNSLQLGFDPFATIDGVLRSVALGDSIGRTNDSHKSLTVLDSVTENEAWKTSLRIGNSWQNISGIRPVNVLYSENKLGQQTEETLVPSSRTHFRPISTSVGSVGANSPLSDTTPITEPADSSILEELTIRARFCKLSQDKSMQTSFEFAVQHDLPLYRQLVLSRPPKANSR